MENDPPGCLTIPALIIVVPLRLLWEVLAAIGRFLEAYVIAPIGWLLHNAIVRPLAWVLRVLVLQPLWWLLRVLVLLPLAWFGRRVLAPLGRMILRYVLRPIGIALAWVLRLIVIPLVYAGRILVALGRMLWPAVAAAGRFIAYVWRLAGVVLFHVLVRPVRFVWRLLVRPFLRALGRAWRAVVVPAARWFRVHALEPARAAARSVSRALGLDPKRP